MALNSRVLSTGSYTLKTAREKSLPMVYHEGRRRAGVLAEGVFGSDLSKTANDLVIFRGGLLWEIVGIIDSTKAGADAGEVLGIGEVGIRIYPDIESLLKLGIEALIIGAAPVGGQLPQGWRRALLKAVESGLDVYNGLHYFLSEDPEISLAAAKQKVKLVDVRKPDRKYFRVWDGSVLRLNDMIRVLVAGTDCDAGKNIATYTIYQELAKKRRDACMIGTGQTMLLLGARGLVLDAVPSDFVAGALEKVLLEAYDDGCRIAVIESQAAITHEAYGHVTLGVLRGASPTHIVIAHVPYRRFRAAFDHAARPLLVPSIALELSYLRSLNPYTNSRLVGITLNTTGMDEGERERVVREFSEVYGVPAVDPLRHGVADIVNEILRDLRAAHTPQ